MMRRLILGGAGALLIGTSLIVIGMRLSDTWRGNGHAITIAPLSGNRSTDDRMSGDSLSGDWAPSEGRLLSEFDHREWGELLGRYVDDAGGVNYDAWHRSDADRAKLRRYLRGLAAVHDPDTLEQPGAAAKAYWINAYNALTIDGILRVYPMDSIRDHASAVGGYNIWKDHRLRVGGDDVSLDDIEHQRLRPMGDPRIHFALVCASRSCPHLPNRPFLAENLDAMLDEAAVRFFRRDDALVRRSDATGNRGDRWMLSKILQWYGEDFGSDEDAILRAIAPMTDPPPTSETRIGGYLPYDWSLNRAATSSAGPSAAESSAGPSTAESSAGPSSAGLSADPSAAGSAGQPSQSE